MVDLARKALGAPLGAVTEAGRSRPGSTRKASGPTATWT